MFALSEKAIDVDQLKRGLVNPAAGALATFEGWVRNHNDGRKTLDLTYEAYESLCNKEAERILTEAKEKFDLLDASCVHRVGKLEIGEIAVWVGAIAAHRGDAFGACRYIIDEIKTRLPIWKKETYENGDSTWINCAQCADQASQPSYSHRAHQASAK